jgi:hypothetical protein
MSGLRLGEELDQQQFGSPSQQKEKLIQGYMATDPKRTEAFRKPSNAQLAKANQDDDQIKPKSKFVVEDKKVIEED